MSVFFTYSEGLGPPNICLNVTTTPLSKISRKAAPLSKISRKAVCQRWINILTHKTAHSCLHQLRLFDFPLKQITMLLALVVDLSLLAWVRWLGTACALLTTALPWLSLVSAYPIYSSKTLCG